MKKIRCAALLLIMSLLCVFCVVWISADDGKTEKLSPAFDVLAEKYKMVKSGLCYENVRFTDTDFKQGLGVSSIDSVVFTKVPDTSDGYLCVGSMTVKEGQRVYGELLSMLEFVPSSNAVEIASFCFAGDESTSRANIECTVRLVDRINYAPTISESQENRLSMNAISGKSTSGTLIALDPEADRMRYEIVSYPSHGTIVRFDMNEGSFVYVPSASYSGEDLFEYVAVDEYGNYTNPASVNITVETDNRRITFSDMENSPDQSAASYVVTNGIMTASVKGGVYNFMPELKLSRAEFIMTAMKAIGKKPQQNTSNLDGIADISSLTEECRGYIAAALDGGYIRAESKDGGLYLRPDDIITKAEAAELLSRLCGYEKRAGDISVFADFGIVDGSYVGSLSAMYECGVIECTGGLIMPNEQITREACARMLYRFKNM